MYSILSLIFRYLFILLIYLFMFGIIRLMYLDIKGIKKRAFQESTYLKLINRKDDLYFKVEESYSLGDETTIGRSSNNDIVIKDPYISKKHALIEKENEFYFIKDLGSSNGTFVNDEQVLNSIRLEHGDSIKIGQVNFLFVSDDKWEKEV